MNTNFTDSIDFVIQLAKHLKAESIIELSKYTYIPQSIFDNRTIIRIPTTDINREKLVEISNSLCETEELAIHSRIYRNGKIVGHIPMIDFADGFEFNNSSIKTCSQIIPKKIIDELNIFSSGRSFHAYSFQFISHRSWIDFNGRLLLLNLPNQAPIVDSRWIGHRIMAGYASLRLTNNSGKYIQSPRFLSHFRMLQQA